jgi:uncharacterized protein (DUF58 family)
MFAFFRRITRRRMRKFTILRDGKYLILLSILLGVSALNTGTNLLYLVFSILLSVIIASGILSGVALWNLDVTISLPEHLFAQEPFESLVALKNRKKRFSTYSIWVQERNLGSRSWGPYFQKLKASEKATQFLSAWFPRRGLYRVGNFRLRTSFPFHFFEKEIEIVRPREVLVYPRLGRLDWEPLLGILEGENRPSQQKGDGSELWNIRSFHPGDSPKQIHWRVTAKAGKLMVKEHETDESRILVVVFDGSGIPRERMQSPEFAERFEEAVSGAASLAWGFLLNSYTVQFLCAPHHCLRLKSLGDIYPALEALALACPAEEEQAPELIARYSDRGLPASTCLWVSPLESEKPDAMGFFHTVRFLDAGKLKGMVHYDNGQAAH